jgi:hypothetical protein
MSAQHRGDLEDIAERWAEADEESPPDPSRLLTYNPRAPKQ